MKNLKKILALVLAFACAFTMFAGAAFPDQADISVDSDVVDTLVSLGVIDGYADGTFRPEETVTRSQMAKMIYIIRTGRSSADAYNDDATTFTDISDHWARGYIKYCQSMGIISGKSATRFDPDGIVTTQEAAKMLLVTLGYDAERAGLVGAGWGQNTTALADENGLLENVNNGTTQGLQRQYAAQMIYNAIDTPMVVYRDGAYTNVDVLGNDNNTIGESYMDLNTVEGIMASFQQEDGRDTYGMEITNITKINGDKVASDKVASTSEDFSRIDSNYFDMKNQKVRVLYKETDEVYGVFALSDSNTVLTGVLGDFEKDSSKLKFDGSKYTVDSKNSQDINVDGETIDANDIVAYVDAVEGLDKAFDATAISNTDSGKINLLDVRGFAIGQVTYVGSDYINVSYKLGSNTYGFDSKLDADDVTYPSDIAKDDYVAVTPAANTADGNIGVTVLDMVTGKITSTKNSGADDFSVYIDGTWYEMAMENVANANDLDVDKTVAIVVKGNYCLLVDDTNAGSNDVALLTEMYQVGNRWEATLVFADGSSETVTLKKNEEFAGGTLERFDGTNASVSEKPETSYTEGYDKAQLVKYTVSSGDYKLTALSSEDEGEHAGFDGYVAATENSIVKSNRITASELSMSIDSNATVFVRYDEDKFRVMTGADLRVWDEDDTFYASALYDNSNGVKTGKIIFADLRTEKMAGGSDLAYGYVFSKYSTVDSDSNRYYEYAIWNGENTVTVWSDDNSASRGDVIEYSVIGEVEGNTEIDINDTWTVDKTGVVTNGEYGEDLVGTAWFYAAGGQLMIDQSAAESDAVAKDFDYDDDDIILFVDTSDSDADGNGLAAASVSDLKDFLKENGTNYYANAAVYKSTKTSNVDIMVIDIDSELDGGVFEVTTAPEAPVAHNIALDKSYQSFDIVETTANEGADVTLTLKAKVAVENETTVTAHVTGTGLNEEVTFTVPASTEQNTTITAAKAFTMPASDVTISLTW